MKAFYSATELANMKLPSCAKSIKGVMKKAKKENWQFQKRSGRGGGVEYSFDSLPVDVQKEIKAKQLKSVVLGDSEQRKARREMRELAITKRNLDELTLADVKQADCRLLMALLVDRYVDEMGKTKATQYVSDLSRDLALPVDDNVDYNEVCKKALSKQIKGKHGVGFRKLKEWCLEAKKCESGEDRLRVLAPQKQGRPVVPLVAIEWLGDYMAIFRNKNGISQARAYRYFAQSYGAKVGMANVPSINTVRRTLKRMPKYVLQQGRMTGSDLKTLKTYVKRDTSKLKNNDVWVGDGHSLKMKVQHPEHGRPFTPELTVIMDIASRYIVGWSLSYSESTIAVADALRHGMVNHGIPAIYYSDNGGGQTNKILDDDLTGILPRLGVHHETGIAGNPQGRGIIERFMKEAPNEIAMQFATYYGNGADRETTRKTLVAVDSRAKALNAGKTENELTAKQKWAKGKLPTWNELLEMCEACIHWHNNEHKHSALGGATPAMVRQVIGEKMDEADIIELSEYEAKKLYRPTFKRVVQRAWLQVFNNDYWHKDLEPLDGETVMVYVDQHDPSEVIVRDLNEKFICEAKLNGNKCDYFPESLVERSKRKRAERHIKKQEEKIELAKAELNPVIEHEVDNSLFDWGVEDMTVKGKEEDLLEDADFYDFPMLKVV